VSGDPAQNGEKNLTVTKDWSYQPNTNVITVSYRTDTLGSSGWNNGTTQYLDQNGNWSSNYTQIQCFSATCSIDSVTGDIQPGSMVATGGGVHVTGTYTNTSPPPDYLTLWNPAMQYSSTNTHGQTTQGVVAVGVTQAYGGGGSYGFSFTIPNVDTTPDVSSISLTPIYFGSQAIGPPCTFGNIWSFQNFTASAQPHSKLWPTREDPKYDNCYAYLTISGTNHTVNLGVHSTFTENGTPLIDNYGGTYNPGTTYTIGANAPTGVDCANTVSNGHDQFCTNITLNYTGGWVGPDSNVYDGTGGRSGPPDCDNEYNEPYFKVMGAGVAADLKSVGKVDASGTLTCTQEANSGLLAGWNNNVDNAGINRGAGSQLSALALLKITGFASAQTTFATSSSVPGKDLSFANGGIDASGAGINPTTAAENPALGGSYGSAPHCVTPPQPNASVAQSPSPTAGLNLNGGDTATNDPHGKGRAERYRGNLTLTNSATTLSGNTSIFVDGDVYINSNMVLNPDNWGIDSKGKTTVPSFVLAATGNIYIAPGVTQLDGLYTSSGTVYTCGQQLTSTSFVYMPATQLYDSCHNQLLFNGSVIANQVKMMRTFGSLRDEKANQAVAEVNVSKNGANYDPGTCYQPGQTPTAENSCFTDGNSVVDWENYNVNYTLGLPATRSDYTLTINYDNFPNGPWPPPASIGYHYTLSIYVDGVLRTTSAVSASGTAATFDIGTLAAGNHTVTISGYNNYWIPYGGNPNAYDPNFEIRSVSLHSNGTPITPNLTPTCSHGPSEGGAQIVPYTCAAEVIHFSPEMYLGNQTIEGDSKGAVQYNAITSLPPVL